MVSDNGRVAFILAGGIWVGMAVVASAHAGWDIGTLSGGAAAILPIGLGLAVLAKAKDGD
jgi:hypothetical protein